MITSNSPWRIVVRPRSEGLHVSTHSKAGDKTADQVSVVIQRALLEHFPPAKTK